MRLKAIATSAIVALTLSFNAFAQEGPAVWAALSEQKFAFHSEGVVISPTASQGDTIISIPVTHLRAAVVRTAIADRYTNETIVEAGATGYLAGAFGGEDTWCFRREAPSVRDRLACFVERHGEWFITGPANHNEYPTSIQSGPMLTPVTALDIDESNTGTPPEVRAAYRLRRWGRQGADVELLIGNSPVTAGPYRVYHTFTRQADGSALVATPVGMIRLQDGERRGVSISNVSVATP